MNGKVFLFLSCLLLSACAMQRAKDAGDAQARMVGMSKEQVFACMGIPQRKATQGETEIWLYKSGNERTERNGIKGKATGASALNDGFLDALSSSLTLENQVSDKRYCLIHVVMKGERVTAVNYSGPTGGFLTEDEQCAFATRNCLGK